VGTILLDLYCTFRGVTVIHLNPMIRIRIVSYTKDSEQSLPAYNITIVYVLCIFYVIIVI